MLKKLLFVLLFGVNLLSVLTEEICLQTSSETNTTCFPARTVSNNDLDQFTIMCKLSRGIFPFQPRGARDGQRRRKNEDGVPHLSLSDSKFEYRYEFDIANFIECDEGIKYMAKDMFWMSNIDPYLGYWKLIAREFSANDTTRNNTCLGFAVKRDDKMEFTPIYRDDIYNVPKEPYAYEYLVIRRPVRAVYNVKSVESSTQETMYDGIDVGYFSYYNPSEYDQVIELFLDSKYTVEYNFPYNTWDAASSVDFSVFDEKINKTSEKGNMIHIEKKTPYNITIPAYTSLTARIVGKMVTVGSSILATRMVLYTQDGILEPYVDCQGNKIESYQTDFHLEDEQMHHTSEVLVLNYTTIYVALVCIGVVILSAVVVFSVRVVIRRLKGTTTNSVRNEVPYQTLQANS